VCIVCTSFRPLFERARKWFGRIGNDGLQVTGKWSLRLINEWAIENKAPFIRATNMADSIILEAFDDWFKGPQAEEL